MAPTPQLSLVSSEALEQTIRPDRLPLYTEIRQRIDECKSLSFLLHSNEQDQLEVEKQKAKILLCFQEEINNDKTLSNDAKRRTALTQKLNEDEVYQNLERRLSALKNDASIAGIELRYQRDLIKLNLAFVEPEGGQSKPI
ncbi:hypothetical protein U2F10_03200 [Leptothoe sp. EHU-05/26/07-4]